MIRVASWVVALLLVALTARATGRSPDAERRYRAGAQAFKAGKYLAAARAFEDAHALEPRPALTFSAAQAYRRQFFVDDDLAWLSRARELYRRYLDEQPSGGRREHAVTHLYAVEVLIASRGKGSAESRRELPTQILVSSETAGARVSVDGRRSRAAPLVLDVEPGDHRVRVTAPGYVPQERRVLAVPKRLAAAAVELIELPGRIAVSAPPGTEIWLDGKRVGVAPLSDLSVEAGTHEVMLLRAGSTAVRRNVRAVGGRRTSLRVDLELGSQRVAALWTLGGAGGLAVGSAASGGLSLFAQREAMRGREKLDSGGTLSPAERDRYNAAVSRRDDFRSASLGLAGAALVTGAVGALLYAIDSPGLPPRGRDSARGPRSARH